MRTLENNTNKDLDFINLLHFIKNEEDIDAVTELIADNASLNNFFADKSMKFLLRAVIGIIYEALPPEELNWSNVFGFIKLDKYENKIGKSMFDELFEDFGNKYPKSYAYKQYKAFRATPTEPRNRIVTQTLEKISKW